MSSVCPVLGEKLQHQTDREQRGQGAEQPDVAARDRHVERALGERGRQQREGRAHQQQEHGQPHLHAVWLEVDQEPAQQAGVVRAVERFVDLGAHPTGSATGSSSATGEASMLRRPLRTQAEKKRNPTAMVSQLWIERHTRV